MTREPSGCAPRRNVCGASIRTQWPCGSMCTFGKRPALGKTPSCPAVHGPRWRKPRGANWFLRCLATIMTVALLGVRVGEALHPGPWLAPARPTDPPTRVYPRPDQADDRDGWSCDEGSDCGGMGRDDAATEGPPSGDELIDMDLMDIGGADDDNGCDGGGHAAGGHSTDGGYHGDVQGGSDFLPSARFDGRREGMVFRTGHHGVGYYRDHGCRRPRANAPVLCLDQLVPETPREHPPTGMPPPIQRTGADNRLLGARRVVHAAAEARVAESPPRAARQRRARRRRPSADYVVQEATECGDASWKLAGYWAVDTVNPNSWKGAMGYLERTAADAVLVQETRRHGSQVQSAEREAMHVGWRASLSTADRTEADGTTAGLAIAVRKHVGLANLGGAEQCGDAASSSRVHAKWMGGMVRGGIHLLTTWPHHTEGPSPRNLDVLDDLAKNIATIKGPWVAGADWNMSAAALAATGWLDLVDGVAVVPDLCTCEASCIDYFVVQRGMLHMVAGVSVIDDAGLHPHKPVRLLLRADARSLKVRRLRKPTPFPKGGGPLGCLPEAATRPMVEPSPGVDLAESWGQCGQPPVPGSGSISDSSSSSGPSGRGDGVQPPAGASGYARWIRRVESELADAYGITEPEERARHGGRERGPRFVWECALGQQRPVPRYSSGASIKWRTVAQCARDLARYDAIQEKGDVAPLTVVRTAQRALRKMTAMMADGGLDDPTVAAATALVTDAGSAPRSAISETARLAAAKLERSLADDRNREWKKWIAGEGGGALGRQHRFSRTQMGWVPSKVGIAHAPIVTKFDYDDGGDPGVQRAEHRTGRAAGAPVDGRDGGGRILRQGALGLAPMSIQDVVEDQAVVWGEHWAVGQGLPKPQWPDDVGGVVMERPTVHQLRAALRSFPTGTALAWDALHPRALLRLGDARLEELIDLMIKAEADGEWPEEIGTVSIVLLPKPDGGWRPIGLFPAMVRVWMRLRRDAAQRWEEDHARDYFYAGQGRGAQVAAWQHAQRAEMASTAGATFVQLLLDMQKCFEVVPHHLLAREASAIGYPLPLLRLALAAYRLPRALAVGGVHSSVVEAERGIAAGSGLATTELRVLLIRLLDRIRRRYPDVRISAYVDDLTADAAGTVRTAPQRVAEAGRELCEGVVGLGLRLSIGKCKVLASSAEAGQRAARDLAAWGVRFVANAKALGVGVAAGARRVTVVQRQRWRALCGRLHRLAVLRSHGVSVATLFRTGINAAFTYGDDVMGVSDDVLDKRRRTVASAVSAGAQGKSVDAVLALADDRPGQSLDPAYDAHRLPIARWAEAVYSKWADRNAMRDAMERERTRLTRARRPWAAVRGPAGAVLATAERIGWRFVDAEHLVTDRGRLFDLTADPPCVVAREAHEAVARWRWRRLCLSSGCPGGDDHEGGAVCLAVARAMLRPAARSGSWTAAHQAALRSALVNGQWPQYRLYKAGMVDSPFCQLCAMCGISREGAGDHLLVAEPPLGTTLHRLASCIVAAATADQECPSTARERAIASAFVREAVGMLRHGDEELLSQDAEALADAAYQAGRKTRSGNACAPRPVHWLLGGAGFVRQALQGITREQFAQAWATTKSVAASASAWARAMIPSVPGLGEREHGAQDGDDGTFHWVVRPPAHDLQLQATFYTDGSAYDGYSKTLTSLGWSFVAMDASGAVVAAANGVPPPWVQSVAGAEAWALLQASRTASPGAIFKTDCLAVLKIIKAGAARATAPNKPLARVSRLLLTDFDEDDAARSVVWMPAHLTSSHVGRAALSDGSMLTQADLQMNARADSLAKAAARLRRAAPELRAAHVARYALTKRFVCHLGRMTHAANNSGQPPARDSQPIPPRLRRKLPRRDLEARPPGLGGHVLVPRANGGWSCQVCRTFATRRAAIARRACTGDVLARWARREATMAKDGVAFATSHALRMLGDIVWCARCAAYGMEKAVGLAAPCKGPPPRGAEWGRHTKMMRLRKGLHPKTGALVAPRSWPRGEVILREAQVQEQRVLAGRFREQLGVDAADHGSDAGGGTCSDGASPGAATMEMDDSRDDRTAETDQRVGRLAEALGRIRQKFHGGHHGARTDGDCRPADVPPPKVRRTAVTDEDGMFPVQLSGASLQQGPYVGAQGVGLSSSSTSAVGVNGGQAAGGAARGDAGGNRLRDALKEAAVDSPPNRAALLASLRAPQGGCGGMPLAGRLSDEERMAHRKRPFDMDRGPAPASSGADGRPARDGVRRRSGGDNTGSLPTAVQRSDAETAPQQQGVFQSCPARIRPTAQVSEPSAKRSRVSSPSSWPSHNGDEAERAIRRLIGRPEPFLCKSGD